MRKKTKSFALTLTTRVRAAMLLIAMLCCATGAWADEVEIGDGTSATYYGPIGTYSNYSITEQLYTADEIETAGTITSISFHYTGAAAKDFPIAVYMANVDAEDLESEGISLADADEVFNGTLSVPAEDGWVTIELDTPFAYDGTSNLLIGINKGWVYFINGNTWYFTATESQMTRYNQNDFNAYDITATVPGQATNKRPNIKIDITPSGPVYKKPTDLIVSDLTSTGATISWTAPEGSPTGYAYQYKKASDADWSAETSVNTTSVALSGLEPAKAYNFRVKAVYGTDGESKFVSINFTTDCDVITTFPWTENFESYASGNFNALCWVNEHIDGSGTKIFAISTSSLGGNSTHQLQLPDMNQGTLTKLVLPAMDLNGNYQFVLDVYRSNSSYNDSYASEGIRVFVSADGQIEDATEIGFIPRQYDVSSTIVPAEAAVGWYTYEVPIPMTGTCHLILRGESQYCTSTYMDNFVVELAARKALETAIAIATNINPEGFADAIAAAQAALNDENATAESMAQAAQTLEAAIKTYFGEVLPNLGAIVTAINEETLNTAYANAQAALADEDVTPQELAAAMQQVITAAQAVAPEHLQNLKGYAVKYGAENAASLITLIDNALAAIQAGNVSQIIATMTAVKTAATPLAQQVLSTMINYVQAFGLTEQAAQAQAALDGDNYITMITTAKALFTHLVAAAQEYLPKLGDIAEGLNDETLNTAYAAAQALLAQESITPEELAAAMQNIITAAQAVAPEHLQNLKGYAVKYGAEDAASLITLIDNALAAIEAGNVSQIIATMTAVKEAATPLAQQVLSTMIGYVQAFGLTEQAAQAQAALDGGNYITMITTAKALFTHLIAAAQEYLPKLGDIVEGLNDETLNKAYAAAEELLAKESITPEELGAAMQNIIVAAKAVAPEHLQNLKGYAVKYGATDAATLIDAALAAIEAGNVSQIIATMTAVKEAATPLATSILTQMIEEAKNYEGLAEDVTAAQAVLAGGNYISMIITAKALYAKLTAIPTGISTAKAAADKDVWYDMNGRKLQGKPTVKGVYMKNNMKVVVK